MGKTHDGAYDHDDFDFELNYERGDAGDENMTPAMFPNQILSAFANGIVVHRPGCPADTEEGPCCCGAATGVELKKFKVHVVVSLELTTEVYAETEDEARANGLRECKAFGETVDSGVEVLDITDPVKR